MYQKEKRTSGACRACKNPCFCPLYMQIGKVLVPVNVVIADKVPILHPHALTFLD